MKIVLAFTCMQSYKLDLEIKFCILTRNFPAKLFIFTTKDICGGENQQSDRFFFLLAPLKCLKI